MLNKKFKTWPADPILNAIFLILNMHIINLGYLEDGFFWFTEFSDGNTEELNGILEELNNAVAISNYNNKHLLDLLDLKAKLAKNKKEKAQKHQWKKIKLA